MRHRLAILGSTGSIGTQALAVADHLQLQVVALAAGSNAAALEEQARRFRPKLIALADKEEALKLQQKLPGIEVLGGEEGLCAVATMQDADCVISAISGTRGLASTFAAIEAGKKIALANKEVLVSAGALALKMANRYGATIIPVDSEHSAIFQCLQGQSQNSVKRLILTASGGPFYRYSDSQLASITAKEALAHPTWNMGPKITVDSSTLMNKGLEVIEAYWLFQVDLSNIDVVIHPQSIIHSMVEFEDNSTLAQLGLPDMKSAIQYALTYPMRMPGLTKAMDWSQPHTLSFLPVDRARFPCLNLAYQAMQAGKSYPPYLNGANDQLVHRFLSGEIPWHAIGDKLSKLLNSHKPMAVDTLENILATDALARRQATTA